MVSVQARKEQARYAIQRGLSQRKVCTLLSISRSSLNYTRTMPYKDAPVIEAMKDLSAKYPRFGSRRIRIFLERIGMVMGKERCARLWAKAELQVPRKRRSKRVSSKRQPMAATRRNSVWCYDFVHDACANGQKLKCLTVVDEFTKECLAIEVASSIRSAKVVGVLAKVDQRTWSAPTSSLRQRARMCEPSAAGLGSRRKFRSNAYRARQAMAKVNK